MCAGAASIPTTAVAQRGLFRILLGSSGAPSTVVSNAIDKFSDAATVAPSVDNSDMTAYAYNVDISLSTSSLEAY
jgi:hypothetical protein